MRYSLIPKVKLKKKSQSRIGEIQNNPCYLNLSLFFLNTCLRAVQLNVRKQVSHSFSKMLSEYRSFHLGSNCYSRGFRRATSTSFCCPSYHIFEQQLIRWLLFFCLSRNKISLLFSVNVSFTFIFVMIYSSYSSWKITRSLFFCPRDLGACSAGVNHDRNHDGIGGDGRDSVCGFEKLQAEAAQYCGSFRSR